VGDISKQDHDFEPGIRHSGLFWTISVPADTVHSNLPAGHARYHMHHQHVPDHHDFFNAVSPHPEKRPGVVSFDVRYSATGPRAHIRDTTFGFKGLFAPAELHIDFRATDRGSGVVWHSVRDGQNTVVGGMGHERNGVFFG